MGIKSGVRKKAVVKSRIQKPKRSKNSTKSNKKREAELQALVEKNLDNHFKRIGYKPDKPPRTIKKLLPLFVAELKSDGWVDAFWIWKNGINRAELVLLRKALVKKLK